MKYMYEFSYKDKVKTLMSDIQLSKKAQDSFSWLYLQDTLGIDLRTVNKEDVTMRETKIGEGAF